MVYINEDEDCYKYLIQKAVQNQSKDLLKTIPKNYMPNVQIDDEHLELYCKENNLFNIQYITLTCEDEYILTGILDCACEYDKMNIVRYLIENNINIDFNSSFGLCYASGHGNMDMIRYLVRNGADIHDNDAEALRWASKNGHLDAVKYLVKNGADIHARNDNALRYSCIKGHLDIVKYLVECGANIHAHKEYVLKWASKNCCLEIVEYLKECISK